LIDWLIDLCILHPINKLRHAIDVYSSRYIRNEGRSDYVEVDYTKTENTIQP